MSVNLKFSFLISNLKNSAMVGRREVSVPRTSFNRQVLLCLQRNGYISHFFLLDNRDQYCVKLNLNALSEIRHLRILSSSSRRQRLAFKQLSARYNQSDFFLISSHLGILLSTEVFYYGVGGVLLCDNKKFN